MAYRILALLTAGGTGAGFYLAFTTTELWQLAGYIGAFMNACGCVINIGLALKEDD